MSRTSLSEFKLVKRNGTGELESLNELMEIYQGQIYNLTMRMMGTHQDAEYATRETFAAVEEFI